MPGTSIESQLRIWSEASQVALKPMQETSTIWTSKRVRASGRIRAACPNDRRSAFRRPFRW